MDGGKTLGAIAFKVALSHCAFSIEGHHEDNDTLEHSHTLLSITPNCSALQLFQAQPMRPPREVASAAKIRGPDNFVCYFALLDFCSFHISHIANGFFHDYPMTTFIWVMHTMCVLLLNLYGDSDSNCQH